MTNAQQVLDTPLDEAETPTIRAYLTTLLATLWAEGSNFSSRRPLGDSDWQWTVYAALVKAGLVVGTLDEDGYLEDVDTGAADNLMQMAIEALTRKLLAERDEILAHYSRALDEVYRLRKAAAYEATLLDAHLRWKSLPSTARQAMDRQAQRLYQAARGEAEQAYKAVDGRALREALLDAGAEEGLSRGQWEDGG